MQNLNRAILSGREPQQSPGGQPSPSTKRAAPEAHAMPPCPKRPKPSAPSTAAAAAILSNCHRSWQQWSVLLREQQQQQRQVQQTPKHLPQQQRRQSQQQQHAAQQHSQQRNHTEQGHSQQQQAPLSAQLLASLALATGEAPAVRFPLLPTLCVTLDSFATLQPLLGIPVGLLQRRELLVAAACWLVKQLNAQEQLLLSPHFGETCLLLASLASVAGAYSEGLLGSLACARQLAQHAAQSQQRRQEGQQLRRTSSSSSSSGSSQAEAEAAASGAGTDHQPQPASIPDIRACLLGMCWSRRPLHLQAGPQQAGHCPVQQAQHAAEQQPKLAQPAPQVHRGQKEPQHGPVLALPRWAPAHGPATEQSALPHPLQPRTPCATRQPGSGVSAFHRVVQSSESLLPGHAGQVGQVVAPAMGVGPASEPLEVTPLELHVLGMLRDHPQVAARLADHFGRHSGLAAGPACAAPAGAAGAQHARLALVTPLERLTLFLLRARPDVAARFADHFAESQLQNAPTPPTAGLPAAGASAPAHVPPAPSANPVARPCEAQTALQQLALLLRNSSGPH